MHVYVLSIDLMYVAECLVVCESVSIQTCIYLHKFKLCSVYVYKFVEEHVCNPLHEACDVEFHGHALYHISS